VGLVREHLLHPSVAKGGLGLLYLILELKLNKVNDINTFVSVMVKLRVSFDQRSESTCIINNKQCWLVDWLTEVL